MTLKAIKTEIYLEARCCKHRISSRFSALYTKLTILASLEDINTTLLMYFLITSSGIMFQSLFYKIQLELALQLGNTQHHSSQRAFLGFSSGAGAWVSESVFVFAVTLLGEGKCKVTFDFSQVLRTLQDCKSCKVHSVSHTFTSLKVCGFFICNVILLRKIAAFSIFFFFFCLLFFFFSCGNKTKLLARHPALTALFLLLCEVWCHHLALGKALSRWDSHKWPFCAPDLHVKKSDGNCLLWWLPLSFQLSMIW